MLRNGASSSGRVPAGSGTRSLVWWPVGSGRLGVHCVINTTDSKAPFPALSKLSTGRRTLTSDDVVVDVRCRTQGWCKQRKVQNMSLRRSTCGSYRIVSYRDILSDIISYLSFSLMAVSCHHYTQQQTTTKSCYHTPTVDILTLDSSCDLISRSSGDLCPVADDAKSDVMSEVATNTQSVDWLRCFDDGSNVVSLSHTHTQTHNLLTDWDALMMEAPSYHVT